MENALNRMEPLFEKIEDYGNTSFELYKLKTVRKSAKVISTFVSRIAVVIVLAMFMIFASLGLALWLGAQLGETYLGFFSVAIFYIVLGALLFFALHNFIKRKISTSIIKEFFNQ